MSTFSPNYQVIHVSLDVQLTVPLSTASGRGMYIVLWWKGIVLGDLWVESDQILSAEDYHQALLRAIMPSVEYYAAKNLRSDELWTTWFLKYDFAQWYAWMDTVFLMWYPTPIQNQVPISVIICTRNRAKYLKNCLQKLRGLHTKPSEIIIVDNAPTDTSTEEVVREFAEVVYLCEPRAGLDIARNRGIKAAQNSVVAFVDDDVEVNGDLLYHIWETFGNPDVMAMTGLVVAHSLQTEAQIIFEKHWSFNRGYVDKFYALEYLQQPAPPVWEIGAGANMAFRKSVFEKVGFFDELLGAGAAGCSDDSEMWHRILSRGYIIHYNPRAVSYHTHRERLLHLKRQLFFYLRGHAVAALIQQEHRPQDKYWRHLIRLFINYIYLIKIGFPFFRFRSRTLWSEISGLISGILYYYYNKVFDK